MQTYTFFKRTRLINSLALAALSLGLGACDEQLSNTPAENVQHLSGQHTTDISVKSSSVIEDAQQLITVPGFSMAISESFGLRLLDESGTSIDEYKGKFELGDYRFIGGHLRLLLVDKNRNTPTLFTIDNRQLKRINQFSSPSFNIDGLCLSADANQLFSFYLDGEGRAQQWLLADQGPARIVRSFTTAPGSFCSVDDSEQRLYVGEENSGVWSYEAQAEAEAGRKLIALSKAWGGVLGEDIAGIRAIAGGFAAISPSDHSVALVQSGELKARFVLDNAGESEQLALQQSESNIVFSSVDENGHVFRWSYSLPMHKANTENMVEITAHMETLAMPRHGDVADDPAIWFNAAAPEQSLILGTNKTAGLHSYQLNGEQRQFIGSGRLNNVDIAYQVPLSNDNSDIAAASLRDNNSIAMFHISSDGTVSEAGQIATSMSEIYGLCMFQSGEKAYVLANDKSGLYQQYEISGSTSTMSGTLRREFSLPGQPEGCTVDEKQELLFMGEEDAGIWVVNSRADSQDTPKLIHKIGDALHDDVEGMAIYQGEQNDYLIVSSQGNNSYAVFDTTAPYQYRGSFRITMNAARGIDGTSETDGLDVSSANFGGVFTEGMLVVQDGHNVLPSEPQNFKAVSWTTIKSALQLN
ncbi:phytase [Pseudoteredinibacter isoporae]|uniref:3-phytase n=1 Tax=Pseudoteredinibacter isoporae TaxID=570281 RepID=A0A7X0MUC7_9GAMM|nr:phytase [Pseudoteredinibacter isoporae]MBB6520143.1 3-phytase [Pseudoteredinibacter isoporae]NHO85715.1 phytase [Pseudoteredinibacter isoporae]NIB25833.1 phytase [Pseudoteredinibacter isoporae]